MQRVFRIVKKKKNLRRLSVVWLFLVTVELFCPVFCETRAFAAEPNIPPTEKKLSLERKAGSPDDSATVTASDDLSRTRNNQIVCDDCLCHATAIPSINRVAPKEPFFCSERIAFHFGEPLFNSLPPPYHPPKLS